MRQCLERDEGVLFEVVDGYARDKFKELNWNAGAYPGPRVVGGTSISTLG